MDSLNLSYLNPKFDNIYYLGKKDLLDKRKISIVGTRRPNSYTKNFTHKISQLLSNNGIVIVSGAAMGVDAISHKAAGESNTIAVVANSLDIRYPSVNRNLIQKIEEHGLMLSFFEKEHRARPYDFVSRNELVVALGEVLIVTEADINSGSMRSVEFALKQNKKIYVLPHRIGESEGTNSLINSGLATVIDDIDILLKDLGLQENKKIEDELLLFCQNSPTYDILLEKFGDRVFEYELEGKIKIENGVVRVN